MVLDEFLEVLGNRSEFVRILVIAMTTAGDDASGSNFIREVVVGFSLVYNKFNVLFGVVFWFVINNAFNFGFQDCFNRSICTF